MRVEGLGLRIGLRRHGLPAQLEQALPSRKPAPPPVLLWNARRNFAFQNSFRGSGFNLLCRQFADRPPRQLFAIGKHDLADHPHRRAPHARSEGDRDLIPRMQCFGIPASPLQDCRGEGLDSPIYDLARRVLRVEKNLGNEGWPKKNSVTVPSW